MPENCAPDLIRVFILTDIRLYRESLSRILSTEDRIEVIGTAGDVHHGIEKVQRLRPDIVVFHVTRGDAVSAVRALIAAAPAPKVVALGLAEVEREFIAYAEAGACGFVTLEASLLDLVGTIHSVTRGEALCSPRMSALLIRRVAKSGTEPLGERPRRRLTSRELEVVRLIDRGLSNKEIARQLQIRVPTVKNHIHSILEKLQVRGRGEAAAWVRAAPR
jgi:two-component system nitrate/nitrite response regulator NarL